MRDAIDYFFAYWLKVLLFEEVTDNLLIVIFQKLMFQNWFSSSLFISFSSESS